MNISYETDLYNQRSRFMNTKIKHVRYTYVRTIESLSKVNCNNETIKYVIKSNL